jgi:hypothetical protein
MDQLTDLFDLPPAYGGIGLQTLERAADEELLGSFAGIAASLIAFCSRTELPVYIVIAEALESMGDVEDMLNEGNPIMEEGQATTVEAIQAVRSAATRVATYPPTDDELLFATQLVRGHGVVEIPGKWSRQCDPPPEPIVIPEPRSLADYALAPCKLEVIILKQIRHAKQAYNVFSSINEVKQSLMRAAAGQCGVDTTHCSMATVHAVARMDCPASLSHDELSEGTLFCAASLHRFGLLVDYAKLEAVVPPETCPETLHSSALGTGTLGDEG